MGILELDHPSAIDTDEMAVVRSLTEVRIKKTLSLSQLDLAENPRLDQQRHGSINRRTRGPWIQLPRAGHQLLRSKMFIGLENRLDNPSPLTGQPQPPLFEVPIDLLLDHCLHSFLCIT